MMVAGKEKEKEKAKEKGLDPHPDPLQDRVPHLSRCPLSCIGNVCKQAHACIVGIHLINGRIAPSLLVETSLLRERWLLPDKVLLQEHPHVPELLLQP